MAQGPESAGVTPAQRRGISVAETPVYLDPRTLKPIVITEMADLHQDVAGMARQRRKQRTPTLLTQDLTNIRVRYTGSENILNMIRIQPTMTKPRHQMQIK